MRICMARKMLVVEVSGVPRLDWMYDVKVALGNRSRDDCRGCTTIRKDRKEWRALVRM